VISRTMASVTFWLVLGLLESGESESRRRGGRIAVLCGSPKPERKTRAKTWVHD